MKPIHPMFVHFPIALLALSVAADVAAFFLKIDSLKSTGWWALAGAAAGGVVAVAAGLFDMRRATLDEEVHHRVHRHMAVGLVLLTAMVGLAVWRFAIFWQGIAVSATYLDCAIVAVVVAGFQGWLGGQLVYRHGVSVDHPARPAGRQRAGRSVDKGSAHHH